jgi:type IV secretory pathway TrbD component
LSGLTTTLTIDALRTAGITNAIAVARDGAEARDDLFEGSERNFVVLHARLAKALDLEVLRNGVYWLIRNEPPLE